MEQAAFEQRTVPREDSRRALDIVLRFQSVFGLVAILVLAAILSRSVMAPTSSWSHGTFSTSCASLLRTASSPSV